MLMREMIIRDCHCVLIELFDLGLLIVWTYVSLIVVLFKLGTTQLGEYLLIHYHDIVRV